MRLREEGDEAIGDPKFFSSGTSVVGSPRAPAVEREASTTQFAHVCHDARNWDALRAEGANEGIVDIDVYDRGGRV